MPVPARAETDAAVDAAGAVEAVDAAAPESELVSAGDPDRMATMATLARQLARRVARRVAGRPVRLYAGVGASYLLIGVVLWWHAWSAGAATHTLCGCGDPALFLWFFQWPATAVAHLHNPFYSTALFHPGGINMLSQTSVMGLSVPLIPVTWIWGPVASLNVASTVAPALSAFAAFAVLRRWVRWAPAAYVGGLLYGFSPFVLSSLEFAHLMTAAVMLLPLIAGTLDEMLVRQRYAAWKSGLVLGLLLFWQFFLSTELVAILAVLLVVGVIILVLMGRLGDRDRLHRQLPHAVRGLVVGTVVGGVLLAYPLWFALDGPAHLAGVIWPNIEALGGFNGGSFVGPQYPQGVSVFITLGGYGGKVLPSAAYLGWGLIAVLTAGTLIWFRDLRLRFWALILIVCVLLSLGVRRGQFEPAHIFGHIPVLDDVIEQRFMLFGFLAAAVMLALILDHARYDLPALLGEARARAFGGARALGLGAAAGATALALVPILLVFGPRLPFTMTAVTLPRWYTEVAPKLPPDRVLLSYPPPFSSLQMAMTWQAVDADVYSQAGGGGPEGTPARAGSARPGFELLAHLAFRVNTPTPVGSATELAAVRHSLAVWRVNTVVIAPQPGVGVYGQGIDPTYAAAYMTAALGRLPTIQAGAWVWDDVSLASASAPPAVPQAPGQLQACEANAKGTGVSLAMSRCVLGS
jgi:hypothetical protein